MIYEDSCLDLKYPIDTSEVIEDTSTQESRRKFDEEIAKINKRFDTVLDSIGAKRVKFTL